ncbi:hypothetical protein RS9916_32142 [Synechococcus sp. RS9916]|nr:hypothetical protein RS9916_32142 [Synechococcus sp. RS9916]
MLQQGDSTEPRLNAENAGRTTPSFDRFRPVPSD